MPKVTAVMETCLYVDDLEAAHAFYGDVLGLELLSREEGRQLFYTVGSSMLLVFDPDQTRDGGDLPGHGADPGDQHFALEVDDLDAWRTRLKDRGIGIEQEVTWPGGAESLYFRDPAGNLGELVTPGLWPVERPGGSHGD